MIKSIQLVNFKNFADETLRVGPFTVIVGANASGKSNIRDAFRFLHGIGRGYTLAEIIGGKYGAGGQIEWAGIRGVKDEIIRFGEPAFYLQVRTGASIYEIRVNSDATSGGAFRVTRERLRYLGEMIYTSHPRHGDPVRKQGDDMHLLLRMGKGHTQKKYGHRIMVRPDQPALTQIQEHNAVLRIHKICIESVISLLANMRFLDLDPDRMRQPAFPGQTVLGDRGEHLPTVLRAICEDPRRRETLVEWMRELTPMDVRDFEFPTDPTTGWVQLVFREANDRRVSAYAASDGTLRFLAMLAALLGPNPESRSAAQPRLYFFEEIDNGIHPSRVRLLIDLIEGRTAKSRHNYLSSKPAERDWIQVVTTTHSPDLLTVMNDETFKNASVVCRLEDSDDAIIRPVAELPRAEELRKSQGLGNLLSGGWMEDALAYTEGYDEEVGK